jgi:hypothetical protein
MTDSDTVVVLPAFETAPQRNMSLAHQLADAAAMMNKAQLGRLVQRKLIYQFALYLFRQVRRAQCACACPVRGAPCGQQRLRPWAQLRAARA